MPTGDFTKELNNLTRLNNKETLWFDFGTGTQGFYCQLIALKCHFSSNTKSNVTQNGFFFKPTICKGRCVIGKNMKTCAIHALNT